MYAQVVEHGFLASPRWIVRFAQFNEGNNDSNEDSDGVNAGENTDEIGAPEPAPAPAPAPAAVLRAAKAEEWLVAVYSIGASNTIAKTNVVHSIPQAIAGKNLTAEAAREVAVAHLDSVYSIVVPANNKNAGGDGDGGNTCGTVTEISAEPQQHSSRTDWTIIYTCSTVHTDEDSAETTVLPFGLHEGEARISVSVADAGQGVHVTGSSKYIQVPEEWVRNEQNTETLDKLLQMVVKLFVRLCFVVAASGALYAWSRANASESESGGGGGKVTPAAAAASSTLFSSSTFWRFYKLLLFINFAEFANDWPAAEFAFDTASPKMNQLISMLSSHVVSALVFEGTVALALAYALSRSWQTRQRPVAVKGQTTAEALHLSAVVKLVALVAGLVVVTQRVYAKTTPPADFKLPVTFGAASASGLLNSYSAMLVIMFSFVRRVIVQGTGGLLFFGLLDNVLESVPVGNSWSIIRPLRSAKAVALVAVGSIVAAVLYPPAVLASSTVGVFPAKTALGYAGVIVVAYGAALQYHLRLWPLAVAAMTIASSVTLFMLSLDSDMVVAAGGTAGDGGSGRIISTQDNWMAFISGAAVAIALWQGWQMSQC